MEVAKQEVNCIFGQTISELEDIWRRLGIPKVAVEDRRRACVSYIRNMLETMLQEELGTEKRICDNIEANERKIAKLRENLGSLSEQEERLFQQTPSESSNETILRKDQRLEDSVQILEKLKLKRTEQATQLITDCRTLAYEVSTTPHKLTSVRFGTRIPTNPELEELTECVNELKEEKFKRLQEFGQIRPRIAKWMTELGISPDDTFEINLLMEPDDAFCVTNENMERLRELEKDTENTRNEREREMLELKSKVKHMWELIEIPVEERRKVEKRVTSLKEKDLLIYRNELDKLTEMRRNSLQELTEKALRELDKTRAKARLTPPVNENFKSQTVSEECLDLITKRLEETKILLEGRLPILEKLYSWKDMVNELEALAIKAKDPSRLWNRGGNLLNEEKKRKALEKSLPKITTAMMKDIAAWEEFHGEFLIDGASVDEFRKNVMEEKENQQKQEQNDKKKKRKMETEIEMKYGSTNPNKAKKSKTDVKITVDRITDCETTASSQNGSTLGEVKVTPWGSMRYSPNKPPVAPRMSISRNSKAKKLTAVGTAIKQYTSKLIKNDKGNRKPSLTTDNLAVPSGSGSFGDRKMRRRSKSLSSIRQDIRKIPKLSAYKPGGRLPLPSASDPSKIFTPKRRHESTLIGNDQSTINRADHSTISMLSETIESRPSHLDQSVSTRFSNVNQQDFVRELLGDRPKNARSSIIPSRRVR